MGRLLLKKVPGFNQMADKQVRITVLCFVFWTKVNVKLSSCLVLKSLFCVPVCLMLFETAFLLWKMLPFFFFLMKLLKNEHGKKFEIWGNDWFLSLNWNWVLKQKTKEIHVFHSFLVYWKHKTDFEVIILL